MQQASNLVANLSPNASVVLPEKVNSVTPSPPLPVPQCRTLWVRMAEIYGHRWTSAYGERADDGGAGDTWAKGLAGITPAQLGEGLKACIASADPWPPTLPEFRARCLGIPPIAQVRLELRGGKPSPFARLVWLGLDAYRYRQSPADQSDRMLRDAYELAREHVMRGGELPLEPNGEIENLKPEHRMATAEQRQRHRDKFEAIMGVDRKSAAAGETADA